MAAKGKGSSYEREICRLLSLWWTEGVSDDYFWRTAGSGAMAKTRSKVGKKTHGHYGDIQAVHPDGEPLIRVWSSGSIPGNKKEMPPMEHLHRELKKKRLTL